MLSTHEYRRITDLKEKKKKRKKRDNDLYILPWSSSFFPSQCDADLVETYLYPILFFHQKCTTHDQCLQWIEKCEFHNKDECSSDHSIFRGFHIRFWQMALFYYLIKAGLRLGPIINFQVQMWGRLIESQVHTACLVLCVVWDEGENSGLLIIYSVRIF